jgi:hypothetical protein
MSIVVRLVVGWAAALWVSAANAQSPASASTLYGRGVDAYFAGNSAQAEQFLDQAIAELPDDPRPYYFRALALLRVGRSDEARSDMEVGASIEARRPKQFAVGTALERVQGSDRLLLEQYRRNGHATAAIERDDKIRGRYAPPAESDSRLLREPMVLRRPAPRQSAPAKSLSDDNPFADESPKTPQPAAAPSDPFATDTGQAVTNPGPASSSADAKMPPGKLMGVFGRVLEKTVPLPSIEALKSQLPGTSPSPSGKSGASKSKPGAIQNTKPSQSNNSEDPFGGP